MAKSSLLYYFICAEYKVSTGFTVKRNLEVFVKSDKRPSL